MRSCSWCLQAAITVRHLTPQMQTRFREWRATSGVGGHTISRDVAALRGALTWAWKNQRIERPPFIADVPAQQKAPARDRDLSMEEVVALMDACAGRDDREHLLRYIVLGLGTAGLPDAILELTSDNIDYKRGSIDPRKRGRLHPCKRRAIVPIANGVLPWVSGIDGKIIVYRIPIAERKQVPGGPTHFTRERAASRRRGRRSVRMPA